ncbi:MAG: DNA primase [Bacillota bacterium]
MAADYGPGRTGRFSDELLNEIRAKSDIVAVIGEYVPLKKRGSNYLGLCPFHQEKTPSFTVTPDKQMFYCFGCQTGGNVFTFLMKREGLTFGEAVEHLAARAGVALPEKGWDRRRAGARGAAAAEADERRRSERDLLYRLLDFASRFYHQALLRSPEAEAARQYLRRRGVSPASVEAFRLGYSPKGWDALLKTLTAKRVDPAVLERAGLVLKGREGHYDRFRGRLMFTIADHRGRPIGFGARALEDSDEPKYLNSPETPLFSKSRVLYGLDLAAQAIRRAGRVLVVEGYMDAIACHEAGLDFTVAAMGTAFTAEQARLLRRHTERVVTAFDADSAGTLATLRGLEVLTAAGFNVKVAEMPEGKDPDECLRGAAGGPEAFRAAIEEAVPLPEYRFRLALRRHEPTTIEGRVAVVKEIVPVLAAIEGIVEREEYLRDFARRLPVPEESLLAELARYLRAASDARRAGVRDSIAKWRNNEEGLGRPGRRGRESLHRPVEAAQRTLLAYMVRAEETLHLVLAELLEASDWCSRIGLDRGDGGEREEEQERDQDEVAAASEDDFEPTEHEASALGWFLNPVHRRVARAVLDLARTGSVEAARLVDGLGPEDEEDVRTAVRALFEAENLPAEAEKAIRDCVGVLKEHRLLSRIDKLHRRISELERGGVPVEREYAELLRELIDLERHTDGGTGHWTVPGD